MIAGYYTDWNGGLGILVFGALGLVALVWRATSGLGLWKSWFRTFHNASYRRRPLEGRVAGMIDPVGWDEEHRRVHDVTPTPRGLLHHSTCWCRGSPSASASPDAPQR